MRSRKRRTFLVNASLAVVLVAAGGLSYAFAGDSDATGSTVRTVPVALGSVERTVSAAGSLESTQTDELSFGASGTVTKIGVEVGDTVKAGQVLATIDATTSKSQLTAAEAQASAAESALSAATSNLTAAQERLAEAQTGSVTPEGEGQSGGPAEAKAGSVAAAQADVESARAQVANAQAQRSSAQAGVTAAEEAVANTSLRAPRAGTIVQVNGAVGQVVGQSSAASGSSSVSASGGKGSSTGDGSDTAASGTADSATTAGGFIVVSDLGHFQLTAQVNEADAALVKVGQSAEITVSADQSVVEGKVATVDLVPTDAGGVKQYGVRVSMDTTPEGLRPGQSASVKISVAAVHDVLTVPAAAVKGTGASASVTVERDGRQVPVEVEVGVRGDAQTEIASGLKQGEVVVLPSVATGGGGSEGGGRGAGGGGGGGGRGGAGGGRG
ncbi:efflux RND transporter periplasmic adaptor subunit [Streptomyces sp. NPDC059171]|uniref:efflux RND transporter periplasmic adaptor subunit n=1 Tax=Streptomyces sp. NPDC059171 TaxID=3346755 RepID=UPI0036A39D4E